MTKQPKAVDDLPYVAFWAILTTESVTIPGDERSRTNPGHGYPEHSIDYWRMETFADRAEWERRIRELSLDKSYGKKPFKAVKMVPARIDTTTTVSIDGDTP